MADVSSTHGHNFRGIWWNSEREFVKVQEVTVLWIISVSEEEQIYTTQYRWVTISHTASLAAGPPSTGPPCPAASRFLSVWASPSLNRYMTKSLLTVSLFVHTNNTTFLNICQKKHTKNETNTNHLQTALPPPPILGSTHDIINDVSQIWKYRKCPADAPLSPEAGGGSYS